MWLLFALVFYCFCLAHKEREKQRTAGGGGASRGRKAREGASIIIFSKPREVERAGIFLIGRREAVEYFFLL